MSRPIGVTVVAIVLMVTGVFVLLLGLEGAGITKFGLAQLAPNGGLYASTVIISGILSLIAAFGLFTLATWAWYLAVAVLIFRAVATGSASSRRHCRARTDTAACRSSTS
jgi:hypothetical protein